MIKGFCSPEQTWTLDWSQNRRCRFPRVLSCDVRCCKFLIFLMLTSMIGSLSASPVSENHFSYFVKTFKVKLSGAPDKPTSGFLDEGSQSDRSRRETSVNRTSSESKHISESLDFPGANDLSQSDIDTTSESAKGMKKYVKSTRVIFLTVVACILLFFLVIILTLRCVLSLRKRRRTLARQKQVDIELSPNVSYNAHNKSTSSNSRCKTPSLRGWSGSSGTRTGAREYNQAEETQCLINDSPSKSGRPSTAMARGSASGLRGHERSGRAGINRSQSLNRDASMGHPYGGDFMELSPVDSAPSVSQSTKLTRRQESLTVPNAVWANGEGGDFQEGGAMRKTTSFCSQDFYQHALMQARTSNSDVVVPKKANIVRQANSLTPEQRSFEEQHSFDSGVSTKTDPNLLSVMSCSDENTHRKLFRSKPRLTFWDHPQVSSNREDLRKTNSDCLSVRTGERNERALVCATNEDKIGDQHAVVRRVSTLPTTTEPVCSPIAYQGFTSPGLGNRMQFDARKCMSGPSSLNVSTYTLRRPSTVSTSSFRRPSGRSGLVYMHKDSLLKPPINQVPNFFNSSFPMSAGSTCHLSQSQPPNSSLKSGRNENYLPSRRCSTTARLERQKSHRDEDSPPAFLDVPGAGVEVEPGGDSLSPLPNRRMLFRRQGSQQHYLDSSTMSVFEPTSCSVQVQPQPAKPKQVPSQNSNDSESSLKSFNILTPPTIVEIGCSNPDLTVIQNNAAPPQTTIFQPSPACSKSALLSANVLLKPPDESKGVLSLPPRDVQETTLNIPAVHDRRNSSPQVFATFSTSNSSLFADDESKRAGKAKLLREVFAKNSSQSRPEITASNHELTNKSSALFSSSLKESRSSSSSKGFQDFHSSSSGLSTMTNAATIATHFAHRDNSFCTMKRFRHQSRRQYRRVSKNSYHAMLRQRTRRTCSQSYCVCKNCIRYIDSTFQNFSSDLYYVLMTRKLWPGFKGADYNVSAPVDVFSFMRGNTDYPHMAFRNSVPTVNRKILLLLADKIKTSL